jgi:hypothetical protein
MRVEKLLGKMPVDREGLHILARIGKKATWMDLMDPVIGCVALKNISSYKMIVLAHDVIGPASGDFWHTT